MKGSIRGPIRAITIYGFTKETFRLGFSDYLTKLPQKEADKIRLLDPTGARKELITKRTIKR